ncbi:MAG: hypothetical protein ACLR7M_06850, partial [Varibaculum timonense]
KNLENAATFSKFLGREEKPRLRAPLGDVFALPVQLRPPEMEIVVGIGAYCRYWEGGNVALVSVLACMPGSCGGGYCRLSRVSGAGSVKALRRPRDLLRRLEGLLESVGMGTYPVCR